MNIKIKKGGYLICGNFQARCAIGKTGISKNKYEGDGSTPKGKFSLGNLYYRKDRIKNILTPLKKKIITKNMGWCDSVNSKSYNKEINLRLNKMGEKLFRKDHKYDMFIVINYNNNPAVKGKGSAIFIHLSKDLKPTKGCVAIYKKKFLELLKIINKRSKIIIY